MIETETSNDEAEPERIQGSSTCYFQVGLPTCISGKDSESSEGEDKIKLLEDFQNNKLLNAKVNITEWLASLSTQVMKLNKLSHPINDDYLVTHTLAGLPPEYSSVVDHAKIDLRKKTLNLTELKKHLKEKHMQLQKEKGWGEDETALSTSQNSARFQKKGTNPRQTPRFKGRCCHMVIGGIRKSTAENG